jgi:hypothetical protein
MKDWNAKWVLSGGGYEWEGEGKWRGWRRENIIDLLYILVLYLYENRTMNMLKLFYVWVK